MTDEAAKGIFVDGVEYNPAEFSHQQSYLIKQIDDLHKKAVSLQFQLDQVEVAKNAFVSAFKDTVASEDGTTNVEADSK